MVKGVRFLKPLCLAIQCAVVPEDPFYGSFVEFYFKTVKNLFSDCRSRQTELGSLVDDIANDLRGYFVRFCFPFRFICQTCQALCAKGFQGLVEGLTGIAEFFTDSGDEASFMAVSSKHLILDLTSIMGPKKRGFVEQWGPDNFRAFLHAGHSSFLTSSIPDDVQYVKYYLPQIIQILPG